MYLRPVLFLGALLLLLGCSYAISPETRSKADRSLSFAKLKADPQAYRDRTVILGGTVLELHRLKKGTLIELSQRELDYWGKPRRTERSGGTFLVLHPATLDPMVYGEGREITVAGVVIDVDPKVTGPGYEGELLLRPVEFKLWPLERRGWDKPGFMDRLYDPYAPEGKFGY
jgi:outer membrane lipoprotein